MENEPEVEEYSGGEIQEHIGKKTPKFFYFMYVFVFLLGLLWFYLYWNGSHGVLDPEGYWEGLEGAANTRYPFCSSSSK